MTFLKRLSTSCLLLCSTFAQAEITPYFSPGTESKVQIIKAIDRAEGSIDVAMYSFSDRSVTAALQQAAENGLQVRLILNKAQSHKEKAKAFEAAGIDVRYISLTMHHKFAIIDGPIAEDRVPSAATLLTGSGNWSTSSFSRYDEDLLIAREEPELVLAFQTEFNHLWDNAREFGVAYPYEAIPHNTSIAAVRFTSENMEAYTNSAGNRSLKAVVPWQEGVAGQAIIKAVDDAEDVIRIASAHYRRADIDAALHRALERGVKIEMILDQQEFHTRGSVADATSLDEALAKEGAHVRYKVYSRYWKYQTALQMHAKYMIVDDQMVLTGSFNWSRNAEVKVAENLLILHDEELALKYFEHFEALFRMGAGQLAGLKEEVVASEGQGPCAFTPLAMTGKDLLVLRSLYKWGACR